MYLFFVDESGQRDYNPKSSRHFVLGAIGVSEEHWSILNNRINEIKIDCFGNRKVELKSYWLRNPEKCQKHYIEGLGATQEGLKNAVESLYALLETNEVTLFSVVLDKRQMMAKYATPEPATTFAYEMLIERLDKFLKNRDGLPSGMIIHDLIMESAAHTKSHQKELIDLHEKFLHEGRTSFAKLTRIIEGMHFLPTDQSNFLQLADLIAYNVYRQFSDNHEEWDKNVSITKMRKYAYFERLLPKFDRSSGGKIRGFGIKKYP